LGISRDKKKTQFNRNTKQHYLAKFVRKESEDSETKSKKNLDHFSICACHPCAGAMLIFSVSFQFYRMSPKGQTLVLC